MPLRDKFWEVNLKEFGVGAKLQTGSPEVADGTPVHPDSNPEEIMEQLEVRGHSEEALTESYEICYMENSIRRDVVQLTAVEMKQSAHKTVQRTTEPPPKVLLVDHMLTIAGSRWDLVIRNAVLQIYQNLLLRHEQVELLGGDRGGKSFPRGLIGLHSFFFLAPAAVLFHFFSLAAAGRYWLWARAFPQLLVLVMEATAREVKAYADGIRGTSDAGAGRGAGCARIEMGRRRKKKTLLLFPSL